MYDKPNKLLTATRRVLAKLGLWGAQVLVGVVGGCLSTIVYARGDIRGVTVDEQPESLLIT